MNEDILCIDRFLKGEERGFEELVRRYQDRVLNIVRSLTGKDAESEDIAQEVFMKVYYGLKSFKKDSRFSTWLYRITVNTTYSFRRGKKVFFEGAEALENSPDPRKDPGVALLAKEREAMLRKAMDDVPINFRTALVLKDVEGLSYTEISEVLGCRIGTVESRIYRARQFLRESLLKLKGGAV
jgi:RNA polymerase sigma-70 factor (ECF subfamily)